MSFEIAKAGWMHRLSSILRNWKRAWFVLYTDGTLRYFESPDSHVGEDAVSLPRDCQCIKGGPHVKGLTPPPDRQPYSLLELTLKDKTWHLCAESEDDAKAWYLALEDAKALRRHAITTVPPSYTATVYPQQTVTYAYPGQYMYGTQPIVIQQPPGSPPGQTVVIVDDRRRHYYDDGTSGFLMGAALGSLMFYPFLWW